MTDRDMFSISLPAVPEAVPEARRAVVEYAQRAGLSGRRLEDLRLAVSEAVTNVVLHAYQGQPGELHVSASAAGEELWVVIGDDGSGMRSRGDSPGLGLGLGLIGRLSDELEVQRGVDGGTELAMGFRLAQASGAGSRDRSPFPSLTAKRLYA